MTLSSIAKKRILQRISYHAVYDNSIMDALEFAYENGFAGIQLTTDSPHLSFESLPESSIIKIRSFLENKNLYLTIHAPDEAISPYTNSKVLRKGVLDYCRVLFDFASKMKAPLVTIHLGTPISFRTDTKPQIEIPSTDLKLYKSILKEYLETLVNLVENRFLLCVENYQMNQFNMEMMEPYLASKELSICWDLAKSYGNMKMERYLMHNVPHIKQLHLHDVCHHADGSYRTHCVIGTGELDFRYYLSKTSSADIVDYCIEVRPREKAKESLEALKLILCPN